MKTHVIAIDNQMKSLTIIDLGLKRNCLINRLHDSKKYNKLPPFINSPIPFDTM
jgi:hypothetical protein